MAHELLAEGLGWAEGPTVLPDGRVCFVETYRSHIGVWERGRGVTRYAYTAGGPNSCVLGQDGVLYACQNGGTVGPWRAEEMLPPSIQRIEREGGPAEIIATELDGVHFNGPNDLVFGPDGRLYITDPGTYRPDDPEPSRLFVMEPDGTGRLLAELDPPTFPNGIAVETDGNVVWLCAVNVPFVDLRAQYESIRSVCSKSAITPSFIGRIAMILPGVRPSISLASLPTASTFPVF